MSGTNGETGAADLGPAEQVKQAVDAGQLAAHQPLPLHQAARLPAMQVIDGCHHHHVCGRKTENQSERAVKMMVCRHKRQCLLQEVHSSTEGQRHGLCGCGYDHVSFM